MIKNKTRNTLITSLVIQKKGLGKILGLIGNVNPKAVVFNTRFGIHTFLLNFAIDIIILDKNSKAVALKENLKPNKIFLWNPVYDLVIELPVGSIQKSKTQKGDIIEIDL